jgi:peroxiredoxin Q/BCP
VLKIGSQAPDFSLADEDGKTVTLSQLTAQAPVVLMFYPADQTPGCTRQLCAARDDYDKYRAQGIEVFGVNPGSASSHKRFSEKHNMRTPLLVDAGGAVARAYDALMPIPLITLVNRTVVGIDRNGTVRFYERGMPPTERIIAALQAAPTTA